MNKTIGILAHVDAGKTTFSECLLYHTNTIKKMGRVDHKDSYLDNHEIERERGITIFSDQGIIDYGDDRYYIVDTPGHIDFSADMERSIMIMDYAVVIISGVEGVQGHTETLWSLLETHNIPTFIFINKMDRTGADLDRILKEINTNLTKDTIFIDVDTKDGLSDGLIEGIAERDEELLDLYMEDKYELSRWNKSLAKLIKKRDVVPVFSGSALNDQGVMEAFNNIHHLSYTDYSSEDLGAIVYKINSDEKGTRVTHIKINSGVLRVRDELTYRYNDDELTEKITQIRVYNGKKYTAVDEARAGQIVGVIGLGKARVGQGFGEDVDRLNFDMIPALKSRVLIDSGVNIKEVINVFNILNDEEPSLNVYWDEELSELQVNIMGPIQLEILKRVLSDRFNLDIDFDKPSILYKETIRDSVVGYGHFEPLKHYAEVHLAMEAGERGSGITFINKCHADDLSVGNQNLVKQHVFEREHRGLLTGNAITDLKITLLTGRGHNMHTSGGDFRQATYRALRQGLEQADNQLLEPYYDFKIRVHIDHMGRVLSDIQRAKGSFEPPITQGEHTIINGRVPVATFMDYQIDLLAFTKGRGSITLTFGGYDICHNTDEVVDEIGYDKNVDKLYSSSSIFCSKGQGYEVTWENAKDAMHCI